MIFSQLLAISVAALLAHQSPVPKVSLRARSVQPGEVVVITIATPAAAVAVHARAFDRDWPAFAVDAHTWRIVLGIDLDVVPGKHEVAIGVSGGSDASFAVAETLDVTPKTFSTRRLTVDPDFVNPPADMLARITSEAEDLGRLWQSSNPQPLWDGPFRPVVPHAANSAFGTRSIFNGQPRSAHGGADFRSPAGTPVKAPAGGRVLLARDLYFTGGTVMIDHGAGLISLFAHLSSMDVAPDAVVAAGQVIGRVGATGRVTGAHLHWTVRAGGARVDPLALLDVLGQASTAAGGRRRSSQR